jgi:hypothetical protein|tara:strand:+ start:163 stop:699 length:537 start_codon:yes stop_codon:yes gene_type:complete
MKLGSFKFFILLFTFLFLGVIPILAEDTIETVPLINLEELSPTFEEDKDELEKIENQNNEINIDESITKETDSSTSDKIYINLNALDKITAKTSTMRLAIGEKFFFGPLEIVALKCQISINNNNGSIDTTAYLQVKDLSNNDNNQVFLFNGWTFASSPTLKSIDHPVYDLWITGCENI